MRFGAMGTDFCYSELSLRRCVRRKEESMLNNISRKASCFVFLLVMLMFAAGAAFAQVAQPDNNVEPVARQVASTVTASATAERVRFPSPNTVVQLRLDVY